MSGTFSPLLFPSFLTGEDFWQVQVRDETTSDEGLVTFTRLPPVRIHQAEKRLNYWSGKVHKIPPSEILSIQDPFNQNAMIEFVTIPFENYHYRLPVNIIEYGKQILTLHFEALVSTSEDKDVKMKRKDKFAYHQVFKVMMPGKTDLLTSNPAGFNLLKRGEFIQFHIKAFAGQ